MQLTDEDIAAFQMLYERKFGLHIEKPEALEKALKLIRLVQLTHPSITPYESP